MRTEDLFILLVSTRVLLHEHPHNTYLEQDTGADKIKSLEVKNNPNQWKKLLKSLHIPIRLSAMAIQLVSSE